MIAACTQRAGERAVTADIGGKAWGTAHVKHAAHVRDVGGVQAQGLVEGLRDLPRVESRAHTVQGRLRAGRREAMGDGGVHAACRGERATADIIGEQCAGRQRT